jgi:hypothetical protein
MRRMLLAFALLQSLAMSPAIADEAGIAAARSVVESQIRAFQRGDDAAAYAFAAPGIKRFFPTLESFMGMVANGYQPVQKPRSFAFGTAEQPSPTTVIQRVQLVGPDGKDYEAVYTLEMQPDGGFLITGVSLNASSALSI